LDRIVIVTQDFYSAHKAKSRESAYSQALIQKIDRQQVRPIESGMQTVRRLWYYDVHVNSNFS